MRRSTTRCARTATRPTPISPEWFNALEAPGKRLYPIEHAAHSVAFEQLDQFGAIIRKTVLPATYPGR